MAKREKVDFEFEDEGKNSTTERIIGWMIFAIVIGIFIFGVFLTFTDYKQFLDSKEVSETVLEGINDKCLSQQINYSLINTPECVCKPYTNCNERKVIVVNEWGEILQETIERDIGE